MLEILPAFLQRPGWAEEVVLNQVQLMMSDGVTSSPTSAAELTTAGIVVFTWVVLPGKSQSLRSCNLFNAYCSCVERVGCGCVGIGHTDMTTCIRTPTPTRPPVSSRRPHSTFKTRVFLVLPTPEPNYFGLHLLTFNLNFCSSSFPLFLF